MTKQKVWQPIGDGRYEWENSVGDRDVYLRITNDGQTLEQWTDNTDLNEIDMGHRNYRLCQLVEEPAVTVMPVRNISDLILMVKHAKYNGYLPKTNWELLRRVEDWLETLSPQEADNAESD